MAAKPKSAKPAKPKPAAKAPEPAESPKPAEEQTFLSAPQDTGLSLDRLSAAFAGMLSSGSDPYAPDQEADDADEPEDDSQSPAAEAAVDDCEVNPRSILEAMLFVGSPGGQPLTSQQIAGLMRGVRPAEIDALVQELNAGYELRRCPYTIVSEAAGYRMALREQFARVRDKFYGKLRQARLSQASIEVLATVAYHEPLTAEDVHRLRGTTSGAILSQLVRRQLLQLERGGGRAPRYKTTDRFLELFGLESLADLPRSLELDEP